MSPDDRYARHLRLKEIGPEGQKRLATARVLLVGCGALGSSQAQALARAGVGHLRLADRDLVELSNLQRQTLYDEDDVASGLPKAEAAARKLRRINSTIEIEPHVTEVGPASIERLIEGCDVVLDAADNLETRYVVNDACVKAGIPWVYGGVLGTSGMVMTILPGVGPCLRCVFPEPPPAGSLPSAETLGVLNAAPAIVGALQAVEALQLLLGAPREGTSLTTLELWKPSFQSLSLSRAEHCRCCVERRFDFLDAHDGAPAHAWGSQEIVLPPKPGAAPLDLSAIAARLEAHGHVSRNPYLVRLEREGMSLLVFADGRAVVRGAQDSAHALELYQRFVG